MADNILEWLTEHVMSWVILLILAALFIGIPVAIWAMVEDSRSPVFELKKSEWSCTRSHDETTTIYVQTGKIIVPTISTQSVCDEWTRR